MTAIVLLAAVTVLLVAGSATGLELFYSAIDGAREVATPAARLITSVDPGSDLPIPPTGKIYHAVFPGGVTDWGEEDDITLNDLRSYEQQVGKTAVWVYFSHNWFRG